MSGPYVRCEHCQRDTRLPGERKCHGCQLRDMALAEIADTTAHHADVDNQPLWPPVGRRNWNAPARRAYMGYAL